MPTNIFEQWSERAAVLAEWVWNRLVNRVDVWGGYYTKAGHTQQTTHPAKDKRNTRLLTKEDLVRHFQSASTTPIVGLHSTSPDNLSKWGGLDIDKHGDGGDSEINWKAASGWYSKLTALGFHPLLTSSNGKGGYHLRVLMAEAIPTANMFWFLRQLISNHAVYGLEIPPEAFPKQRAVTERNPCGNWLRLFGRHHTREFWSEIWNGGVWLTGGSAANYILSLSGDVPSLVPADIEIQVRVRAYMAKLPNLAEGQGRDDVAFKFAAWLVRDMKLTDAAALPWLEEWDSRNNPPKGTERLKVIIANSHQYGQRAYGSGLDGARTGQHAETNGHTSTAPPAEPRTPRPEAQIPDPPPWPEPPGDEIYYGLAGDIVRTIEPQTESDPIAILVQFLAMFGNASGRKAYWRVENDNHYANLYVCLVGETAKGRKGTAMGRARQAFGELGDDWVKKRVTSGLSSGEGLIKAVRDPVWSRTEEKREGQDTVVVETLLDAGVTDKRLLVVEPEFGRVLRVMEREGNTLSPRIREGWDHGNMTNLTKESTTATGAHLSIIAHITQLELRRLLTDVETTNGLANRFIWTAVRRSKLLPLGGDRVDLRHCTQLVACCVADAAREREIPFDDQTCQWWKDEVYKRLTSSTGGVLGAITNRAESQVRRLALVYALLDTAPHVELPHLRAALALWDYSVRSCRWVFGDSTGDQLADEILTYLRGAGEIGLTQTEISNLFSKHKTAAEMGQALATLMNAGLARRTETPTKGRPITRWHDAMT